MVFAKIGTVVLAVTSVSTFFFATKELVLGSSQANTSGVQASPSIGHRRLSFDPKTVMYKDPNANSVLDQVSSYTSHLMNPDGTSVMMQQQAQGGGMTDPTQQQPSSTSSMTGTYGGGSNMGGDTSSYGQQAMMGGSDSSQIMSQGAGMMQQQPTEQGSMQMMQPQETNMLQGNGMQQEQMQQQDPTYGGSMMQQEPQQQQHHSAYGMMQQEAIPSQSETMMQQVEEPTPEQGMMQQQPQDATGMMASSTFEGNTNQQQFVEQQSTGMTGYEQQDKMGSYLQQQDPAVSHEQQEKGSGSSTFQDSSMGYQQQEKSSFSSGMQEERPQEMSGSNMIESSQMLLGGSGMTQMTTSSQQGMQQQQESTELQQQQPMESSSYGLRGSAQQERGDQQGVTPATTSLKGRSLEFVHITKTGGTAIETAGASQASVMWGACHYREIRYEKCHNPDWETPKHKFANKLPEGMRYIGEPWHCPHHWQDPDNTAGSDTFVVVRNPYDRLVSEYYCSAFGYKGENADDPAVFNQWMGEQLKEASEVLRGHMLNQYYYVYDLETGEKSVTHILKYENLKEEFDALMEGYGLNIRLPEKTEKTSFHTYSHKKGNKDAPHMTVDDFSPETLAAINTLYAKDFEYFGYPMIDPAKHSGPSAGTQEQEKESQQQLGQMQQGYAQEGQTQQAFSQEGQTQQAFSQEGQMQQGYAQEGQMQQGFSQDGQMQQERMQQQPQQEQQQQLGYAQQQQQPEQVSPQISFYGQH